MIQIFCNQRYLRCLGWCYNKLIKSWTSMFNEVIFREILFPSSDNVTNYVVHILREYADLDGNDRTCGPGWEEVAQWD